MSFMQNEITEKQSGWEIETPDNGTCFVPGDVVSVPAWLRTEHAIYADDSVFELLADMLGDYVDAQRMVSITAITRHYFCRLSAPGYLDCTDWCAFRSLRECRDYLREV